MVSYLVANVLVGTARETQIQLHWEMQ